ncbi:hypothetical protein NPIL_410561 [Nephila pilipes]|uniref:Uncharacterized protein n=1 Tax=Nephila pilipes TaxID=299642 RepID=A0A8X6U780_NEPPI|nr:hypothetical protein NPIL_410561 [Nephila pilipes]
MLLVTSGNTCATCIEITEYSETDEKRNASVKKEIGRKCTIQDFIAFLKMRLSKIIFGSVDIPDSFIPPIQGLSDRRGRERSSENSVGWENEHDLDVREGTMVLYFPSDKLVVKCSITFLLSTGS